MKEECTLPYPYTFLPARAVKENGTVRWFDLESGNELPPYFGMGKDAAHRVVAWLVERNLPLDGWRLT